MKHACTCSTFHFSSLTLFAYEVICHGFVVCGFFFKISLFVVVFLKTSFGNISRVSSSLDKNHAQSFVQPDLGQIVCKGYLQTTLYIVSKEFMTTIQAN